MLNVTIRIAEPHALLETEVRGLLEGTTSVLTNTLNVPAEHIVSRFERIDPLHFAVGGNPVVGTTNRPAQIEITYPKGVASQKQLKDARNALIAMLKQQFNGWVHDATSIAFLEIAPALLTSIGELASDQTHLKAVA